MRSITDFRSALTTLEYKILQVNIFEGDKDGYYDFHKSKMVRTRKQHHCGIGCHAIPTGMRVRYDEITFDRKWHRMYNCLRCIDHTFNVVENWHYVDIGENV